MEDFRDMDAAEREACYDRQRALDKVQNAPANVAFEVRSHLNRLSESIARADNYIAIQELHHDLDEIETMLGRIRSEADARYLDLRNGRIGEAA